MSNASKKMIIGSMGAAALVALAAVADLVTQSIPFSGNTVMDILFIVGAAIIGYLGYDSYKD